MIKPKRPVPVDLGRIEAEFWGLRPPGGFGLIYGDPAWCWDAYSEAGLGKSPEAHYDTMSDEDILRLPVPVLAAKDCVLALWATFPKLPLALDVMHAWGFRYRTGGAWAKTTSDGQGLAFGPGHIFRSAAELLLVGTRGSPKIRSHRIRNCWLAPRREHSRKPDSVADDLERLFDGPRIELFARKRSDEWEVWGNQLDRFDGSDAGAA
ncbi:MAG: DNA methyltransferase [Alphaproteobacteria bacterium]|nr:DNA methyltransferase [Alphaproteobacteria bacterium]